MPPPTGTPICRAPHISNASSSTPEIVTRGFVAEPDARLLAGEQGARATKTDCDFVGDQMHAMAIAGVTQQL